MDLDPRRHPGPIGVRLSATDSAGVDWPRVEAFWARAGELDAVDAVWMSDHLSDATLQRNGPALEALTTVAALAHHLRGRWAGIAVLAATFRHPALVAKSATVLDHATGGRFLLGMGAGWHAGEHDAFGIPLPPIRERFDRYEASVAAVAALFSDAARTPPGVNVDDPLAPLRAATNEPPPLTPGGPPLWLGGTRSRGLALLARFASGWPMPGNRPGDVAFFADRRDAIRRALTDAGRDPDDFSFAAQLSVGASPAERRAALEVARRFRAAGATHVILGLPAALAPEGLDDLVREVAEPLRGS
ncbi:MAG: LLM class flavin-dependent oxidoreductase [Chloroflexota bacterium]